ncbi:hypothetical protein [Candidatus Leptofilum sp.]|uniref:hypothetical protein n=1 Tax=Candidatus Leptofilum sp. TaxID=3241576 RepID=UPI003B5BD48B
MEKTPQFTELIEAVPQNDRLDWVHAVVLNEARQVLIFESPRQRHSCVNWQVLSHFLPDDSDPFTAVQATLLHKTGHQTNHWSYLGSHVCDIKQAGDTGYFFCAQQARQVATPQSNGQSLAVAKWVPLTDLRYALLDGRIALVSHALTVSLALLTLSK